MEFQALTKFFSSLDYAKRKYPQYTTYMSKYLQKLSEEEQHREVEQFKKFLIMNQNTSNNVLDCVEFQTGRPSTVLLMSNFLDKTHDDIFWQNLSELEQTLFMFGKPKELPQTTTSPATSGIAGAMERFRDNPLMTDILGHAKNSLTNVDGIQDVNDLLNTPGFQEIVEVMKQNIMNGQYSLKDLTSSVKTVINSVQDEVDDSTKDTLSAVSSAMSSMENNQQPDLDKLMALVGSLRFSK
jgi:hypothetical protein